MTVSAGVIVQTVDESRKVIAAMDRKEARVLYRTGGRGRSIMRRTIPRRKKKSLAGNPPHAHATGSQGLKDVRYSVSKSDGSVTIGHVRYPRKPSPPDKKGVRRTTLASKPVPQLLNEGGAATMQIDHPERGTITHSANFRQRPFRDKAYGPTLQFFKERLERERL